MHAVNNDMIMRVLTTLLTTASMCITAHRADEAVSQQTSMTVRATSNGKQDHLCGEMHARAVDYWAACQHVKPARWRGI